jgi:hypothetical protein
VANIVLSAATLQKCSNSTGRRPNNSFKPNLLRSSESVAEKACHAFASTTQVGLIQVLDDMAQLAKHTRGGQAWALVAGLLLLYLGVDAALKSYKAGILLFTYRRLIATGPLAAFEMIACLGAGLYLVVSSIRNLEDI